MATLLDPKRPYQLLCEREPAANAAGANAIADVATIFLTASRCPIGCTMCDLHRNTLEGPTPPGAIEQQIRYAQNELGRTDWVKLYNSGNFFDPASIPPSEYRTIAALCHRYDRVIVENHPRFGKSRHHEFQAMLEGRLEIAVGLETVQPRWLSRLRKQMTRDEFDRYAKMLCETGIDLRVFLIVGVPGISVDEALRWTRLSVRHAVAAGARHVSLIPARSGHGWNGLADGLPNIELSSLVELFANALDDARAACCISVDLWDIQRTALSADESETLIRFEAAILAQDPALL